MKRVLLVVLLVAVMVFPSMASAAVRVGVAMPTQSLQRWNQDGSNMKAMLEEAGYVVDLQYANNDVALQVSQIENMILNGAEILVIASIDGASLGTVLAVAKDEGIPVIAYDRLIMETDGVSYYATFDNYMVGTIQGEYLVEKLDIHWVFTCSEFEFFHKVFTLDGSNHGVIKGCIIGDSIRFHDQTVISDHRNAFVFSYCQNST
ncbi:MAG: substrate-binding domain-containing protein [Firmicutes bacterium]|nr:substrate-binding domain-containing protein [Bacillota bacterium]